PPPQAPIPESFSAPPSPDGHRRAQYGAPPAHEHTAVPTRARESGGEPIHPVPTRPAPLDKPFHVRTTRPNDGVSARPSDTERHSRERRVNTLTGPRWGCSRTGGRHHHQLLSRTLALIVTSAGWWVSLTLTVIGHYLRSAGHAWL